MAPPSFFSLDDLFCDASEDFRMLGGELREDLSIECETGLLKLRDESAV